MTATSTFTASIENGYISIMQDYKYRRIGGIQQGIKHRSFDMNQPVDLTKFRQPGITAQRWKDQECKGDYVVDFVLDFDDKEDVSRAHEQTKQALGILRSLGLKDGDFSVYYSGGKGFHVTIPAEVIGDGITIDNLNSAAVQLYVEYKLDTIDLDIYTNNRLIRAHGSPNYDKKTNAFLGFKTPVSLDDLNNKTISDIQQMAQQKPPALTPAPHVLNPALRQKLLDLASRFKPVPLDTVCPAKPINGYDVLSVPEGFDGLFRNCPVFQNFRNNPESQDYGEWKDCITALYNLEGGPELLHELSSRDKQRYSRTDLDRYIAYAKKQGYHNPRCSTFSKYGRCDSNCQTHTPTDYVKALHGSRKAIRTKLNPSYQPSPTKPLIEVRRELFRLLAEIKDNRDGKLHIIKVETRVGKTHNTVDIMQDDQFVWVAPIHDENIDPTLEKVKAKSSLRAGKCPKFEDSDCIHKAEYKAAQEQGFNTRSVVCSNCIKDFKCGYLNAFSELERCDQLFLTHHYLKRPEFWQSHNIPAKDMVIIDEDCIADLIEKKNITGSDLRDYLRLVTKAIGNQGQLLNDKYVKLKGCTDAIQDRLLELSGSDKKTGFAKIEFNHPLTEKEFDDINAAVTSYIKDHPLELQNSKNLTADIRKLVLSGDHVYFNATKDNICLVDAHQLPEGKTIILLSATADIEMYRKLSGYEVVEHHLSRVERNGSTLIQIMDGQYPRASLRRDVNQKGELSQQIKTKLKALQDADPESPITVVCHLEFETEIKNLLGENAEVNHFGGMRGSASMDGYTRHMVVGAPIPNQDDIAIIAYLLKGKQPVDPEMHDTVAEIEDSEHWRIVVKGSDDSDVTKAYEFYVVHELVQAIGRSPYVNGNTKVYIVTNQPLPIKQIIRKTWTELDEINKKIPKVERAKNQIKALIIQKDGSIKVDDIVKAGIRKTSQARELLRELEKEYQASVSKKGTTTIFNQPEILFATAIKIDASGVPESVYAVDASIVTTIDYEGLANTTMYANPEPAFDDYETSEKPFETVPPPIQPAGSLTNPVYHTFS